MASPNAARAGPGDSGADPRKNVNGGGRDDQEHTAFRSIEQDRAPQMARLPWYPRDFRSATLGWPLAARAVYRELLDAQWDLGSLPADERDLRGIVNCAPAEWKTAWRYVAPKFQPDHNGRLKNRRLEEHRQEALRIHKNRKKSAQKAARSRWGGDDA